MWNTEEYPRLSGVVAGGYPAEHGYGYEEWNNLPKLAYADQGESRCAFHTEGVASRPGAEDVLRRASSRQ